MERVLIARAAHEIKRAFCAAMGDNSQPAWEDAPDWQKQSALAGVDMHLANPDATPEQSHESWLAAKEKDGWTYGEVKDAEKKTHPCMKPWAELPLEQRAKDFLFRGVVHTLKAVAVVAPAPVVAAPAAVDGLVPVKYIGARPSYREGTYGSGVVFVQGETKLLPVALAGKLLGHRDVYAPGDVATATEKVAPKAKDAKDEKREEENRVQDLRDLIANMSKNALTAYAKTHFRIDLDAKQGVQALRNHVTQLVDQYGAPQ